MVNKLITQNDIRKKIYGHSYNTVYFVTILYMVKYWSDEILANVMFTKLLAITDWRITSALYLKYFKGKFWLGKNLTK